MVIILGIGAEEATDFGFKRVGTFVVTSQQAEWVYLLPQLIRIKPILEAKYFVVTSFPSLFVILLFSWPKFPKTWDLSPYLLSIQAAAIIVVNN